MNIRPTVLNLLIGLGLLLSPALVQAQHHHHSQHNHYPQHSHQQHYTPNYHVDHHNHIVRDSHGHVIGQYHHDVIHQNSTYVVPHTSAHNHGSYYVHEGNYFYHPQTVSNSTNYQPQQVTFGGYSHVDDLAVRLETLSNDFCLDLHYNYSHNPGFAETYGEAYEILQVAKYIHDAEHANDRVAIQGKLGGLDRLFHHVQDDVRGWSRHHHRQIGQLGILSKMDLIESALHHLMNDVGVAQTPVAGNEPPPRPNGGPEQAPPPAGGFAPSQSPPSQGGFAPTQLSPPPSGGFPPGQSSPPPTVQ